MAEETVKQERTTTVTKTILRRYNTGNYNYVEITSTFTDDIKWKTVEERQEKSLNLDKLLVDSFKKTEKVVSSGLNVTLVEGLTNATVTVKKPDDSL